MHLKRTEVSRNIPIPRKGTKYLARALSFVDEGVPVVIAVRDMLKLAKTSKEVGRMINDKLIKLNGKVVDDKKQSIKLFNLLDVEKKYVLYILPSGRFTFKETKDSERLCKVIGKKMLKGKKTQLNLHDGTNILTKDKFEVGGSVLVDDKNKIKKSMPLEKSKTVFIISGRNIGSKGKVVDVKGNHANVKLADHDKEVGLEVRHLIVI